MNVDVRELRPEDRAAFGIITSKHNIWRRAARIRVNFKNANSCHDIGISINK